MILENALENVVRKFRRHLQIIKPALEMLLQQIEQVCPGRLSDHHGHGHLDRHGHHGQHGHPGHGHRLGKAPPADPTGLSR